MSPSSAIPLVERPAFFPGERLGASDLAATQDYHRTLRWLHNRAMHDWGVALGLAVSGNKGDKVVHITPGLALDRAGREILLGAPVDLQVPAVSGTSTGDPMDFYVTVSYLDDASLSPETRGGDCDTEGAVRLIEQCALRFQHPPPYAGTDWVYGTDIVLASLKVRDCKLAAPTTTSDRREIARPMPYVAAGNTSPGNTQWSLWANAANVLIGVRTSVSTADAGFTTTPRYQARIGGLTSYGSGGSAIRVAGYVQIENATSHSFDCGVLLPQGTLGTVQLNKKTTVLTNSFLSKLTGTLGWHVVWMGAEG